MSLLFFITENLGTLGIALAFYINALGIIGFPSGPTARNFFLGTVGGFLGSLTVFYFLAFQGATAPEGNYGAFIILT